MEKHCRSFDRLQDRLPRGDRWRCFLLLDEDYQLLGYTYLDSNGEGKEEFTTTDAPIPSTGTVELYLEEDSSQTCTLILSANPALIPEAQSMEFSGAPYLAPWTNIFAPVFKWPAWLPQMGNEA